VFAEIIAQEDFYSSASIHALIDYLAPGRDAGWRLRFVRWLLKGTPRVVPPARRMADRLIARNLGPMGEFLVHRPDRLTTAA
jgi:hypothetical protein